MKKLILIIFTALLLVPATASGATNVKVVMHDPGCHAFLVKGHFKKALTVRGSITLTNYDEAALKVNGRLVRVGKSIKLSRGIYIIKMVGQEPDDNTLRLVVN